MTQVIRAQMATDARLVAEIRTTGRTVLACEWGGCHHCATRDRGADDRRPVPGGGLVRYECEPHAEFGEAYDEVRAAAALVFGGVQAAVGAVKRLVSTGETEKHAATTQAIEGVRAAVAGQKRRSRK